MTHVSIQYALKQRSLNWKKEPKIVRLNDTHAFCERARGLLVANDDDDIPVSLTELSPYWPKRLKDNISVDLKEMGCEGRRRVELTQDHVQCGLRYWWC
jgi:hypothetical protein